MRGENSQGRSDFKVVCTWCGGLIRLSNIKDSRGMCLQCYARLLNEHLRPQGASSSARASER
jgi:hypothetical protein